METHVDHALERVAAERETTVAKRAAIETFRNRVADVTVPDATQACAQGTTGGGVLSLSGGATVDGCQTVRRAFAETIRPHAAVAEDASVLTAVRTELSEAIAAALAPETDVTLSPTLVRAIDAEAVARRRETALMVDVLDQEATSLADAASLVEDVTDWLVDADQTPLSALAFDALQARHETLTAHREQLGALVSDRQDDLSTVTSERGDLALCHRSLHASLYADFPVEHPVLSTAVALDQTCREGQRAVRGHLVRRV